MNTAVTHRCCCVFYRIVFDGRYQDSFLIMNKVLKQPVVRNGRQATVGYAPDVWKEWK